MKITDVKTYVVSAGWRNLVFLQVYTDEGITGVGECTPTYGVGTLAVEGVVEELVEQCVIGQDPFDIEKLWGLMYRKSFWGRGGGPYITSGMSGIEEALWDIVGKTVRAPVYKLLGGRCRDKLRVYANTWYSGCRKPEDYAKAAVKVVKDGFTALKFDPFRVTGPFDPSKITGRLIGRVHERKVLERVRAVRDAIGDDVDMAIEVHGGLGTHAAIRIGKKLEKFDPLFYEEPVAPGNVDAMAKVASNVNIPIAAGERLYTKYGFREYIVKQALDIIQPDVGLAGGILESKKISAIADAYYIPIAPHNATGPVATAAAIQLDFCTPNFLIQEIFPYDPAWHYELVDDAPEKAVKNGYIKAPTKPGLGVKLNEEEIGKHLYKEARLHSRSC